MSRRRALTVVEVLVAVAIFTIAITAVIGIFPASARASRQAQATLIADHLLERELEITRNGSYDTITSRTPPPYEMTVVHNGNSLDISFNVTVTVTEPVVGLKHLQATCLWSEPDGFNRTTEMVTDVADTSP